MSRDAFDFIDQIDSQVEFERRKKMVADAEAQMERDAEKAREAKARVDATTLRANESFLLAEYERAGVAPPFTNGRGVPTVSLSLLLSQGWRVESFGDERILVRP